MSSQSKPIISDFNWMFPAILSVAEGLTHFGMMQGDSQAYIEIVEYFRGTGSGQISQWHGFLRPIVPLLAVPFSYLISYGFAIAFVDLGFIVFGTVMTYFLGLRLIDRETGLVAAFSFACALPVLAYGTAVLTDGPGYAMLVTLVYAVLFLVPEQRNIARSVLIGVLFGFAMLTKETSFIGLLFLWLYSLVERKRGALANVVVISLISLAIAFGWAQFIGQSYLGFYGQGLNYTGTGYSGPAVSLHMFLTSIIYAYNVLIPLAIVGFFIAVRRVQQRLLEILISAGLLVVAWPTPPESRLTFLTFPAVIPAAGYVVSRASAFIAAKPVLGRLSKRGWLVLMILVLVAFSNFYARRYFLLP